MDTSTTLLDQLANLQAQIVSLRQQNAYLTTQNAELGQELENTKTELRDTLALLDRANGSQSTSTSKSRSPSLRYTPPAESSSQLKRSRSPTLEYVDLPPPASKKVKESPQKAVKLEFAPTAEVITVDDSDNPPPDTEMMPLTEDGMRPGTTSTTGRGDPDSDLDDPNVSQDEAEDRVPRTEVQTAGRLAPESLRRSARFSSMSSPTTMSTLTPMVSTPELEDPHPDGDVKSERKPKRQPKRQPKLETSAALLSVTSIYLPNPQPFSVTPAPINLDIPRAFLRLAYGGCDQRFLQFISANRNPGPSHTTIVNADGTETRVPKGPRRMVFPMLRTNPLMPRTPGAPGLLFTSRQEILHDPPWTLFFKRSTGKEHAVWLYLGEYECELVGRLTPEQFKAQPTVVKRSWANLVVERRGQECYAAMRAHIALRAVGLIPIDNKEREQEIIKIEVKNIRSKQGKSKAISIEQVLKAFENGDEAISIIRVKCIKYDHIFANDIVVRFDDYPSMVTAANAKKQKKKVAKAENDDEEIGEVDSNDELEELGKPSQNRQRQDVTCSTSVPKSESGGTPSTGSKSRVASSSAQSRLSRSQRGPNSSIAAFVNGLEGVDSSDDIGEDSEGEDAFEDDDNSTWRPSSMSTRPSPSTVSTPARSQSRRTKMLGRKVLDSTGAAEH